MRNENLKTVITTYAEHRTRIVEIAESSFQITDTDTRIFAIAEQYNTGEIDIPTLDKLAGDFSDIANLIELQLDPNGPTYPQSDHRHSAYRGEINTIEILRHIVFYIDEYTDPIKRSLLPAYVSDRKPPADGPIF